MNYLTDFDWHSAPTKTIHGQLFFFASDHPLASKNPASMFCNWVNVARHIVSVEKGRWLKRYEFVAFKDGDKTHLDPSNLVQKGEKVQLVCPVCDKPFMVKPAYRERQIACSRKCAYILQRRFNPTAEALFLLVWKQPQIAIAKSFGVDDKHVSKRCKQVAILIPPRGYWRMKRSGKSCEEILKHFNWSPEDIAFIYHHLPADVLESTRNDSEDDCVDYLTDFDWHTAAIETMRGQSFFYAPAHPLAHKSRVRFGWVKLVRHIASVSRGKWLEHHEVISFKDGDENNIDPDNLVVVNVGNHLKGFASSGRKRATMVTLTCPVCGNRFQDYAARAKYRITDTKECAKTLRKAKFNPSPAELQSLLWKYSRRDIAKLFMIGESTIFAARRRLNVAAPPMGYWNLISIGLSRGDALKRLGWQQDEIIALEETLSVKDSMAS